MGLWRVGRRLWQRAPRQLRFTRSGKAITGIALATGFAAINTGNNLLFLGWGLVLSAIVLSGILSEATLRGTELHFEPPKLARAGAVCALAVRLRNNSQKLPAFALEAAVEISHGKHRWQCLVPYQLRLNAASERRVSTRMQFSKRGCYQVVQTNISTAYPFGFFHKTKRTHLEKEEFWVAPARVDVRHYGMEMFSRAGQVAAQREGRGDEFFALRPFRDGDDPSRIHWRRSCRLGRWYVVDHEALLGQAFLLELWLGAPSKAGAHEEHSLSVLGSLAEDLLAKGFAVGILAPGVSLQKCTGVSGLRIILNTLARVDVTASMPKLPHLLGLTRIALSAGGRPVGQPDIVLTVQPRAATAEHVVERGVA